MSNARNLAKLKPSSTGLIESEDLAAGVVPVSSVNGLTGAVVLSGTPVQVAYAEVFGAVTLSATIPADNTIPQSNEGTQVLAVSITPKKATNYLLVEAVLFGAEQTNVGDYIICPLFRDSGVDAVAVGIIGSMTGGGNFLTSGYSVLHYRVLAGSTATTTFKVRAGSDVGTTYLNLTHGNKTFGGKLQSSLTVTEIEA